MNTLSSSLQKLFLKSDSPFDFHFVVLEVAKFLCDNGWPEEDGFVFKQLAEGFSISVDETDFAKFRLIFYAVNKFYHVFKKAKKEDLCVRLLEGQPAFFMQSAVLAFESEKELWSDEIESFQHEFLVFLHHILRSKHQDSRYYSLICHCYKEVVLLLSQCCYIPVFMKGLRFLWEAQKSPCWISVCNCQQAGALTALTLQNLPAVLNHLPNLLKREMCFAGEVVSKENPPVFRGNFPVLRRLILVFLQAAFTNPQDQVKCVTDVCKAFGSCLKSHFTVDCFSCTLSEIFFDQDDQHAELLLLTISFQKNNPKDLLIDPFVLFHRLLHGIGYDPSVVVDLLISSETVFLRFMVYFLKVIAANPDEFLQSCASFPSHLQLSDDLPIQNLVEKVLDYFKSVRKSLTTLSAQGAIGFNIAPLLKLLTKAIECVGK